LLAAESPINDDTQRTKKMAKDMLMRQLARESARHQQGIRRLSGPFERLGLQMWERRRLLCGDASAVVTVTVVLDTP
jgi:hypothetical protein